MKKFWSVLAVMFVLAPLGVANANTISVSQTIHITGVVPPMRFIVVDGQGNIIEITSNTPENVSPKVYLGSLSDGQEKPLTAALQKDFNVKTRGVDMRSLDIHFSLPDPRTAKNDKPPLLSALGHISVLSFPKIL